MLAVGVMIWLGSELMFFSGLFAAFFTIRANTIGPWPPAGTQLDTLRSGFFTLVLVSSSFTMQRAVFQVEWGKRRSARLWIVATILLGVAFLANQGYEWLFSPTLLVHERVRFALLHHVGPARPARLHRPRCHALSPGRMRGDIGGYRASWAVQGVSYYWHFVDIVWVGLYSCLFLLK